MAKKKDVKEEQKKELTVNHLTFMFELVDRLNKFMPLNSVEMKEIQTITSIINSDGEEQLQISHLQFMMELINRLDTNVVRLSSPERRELSDIIEIINGTENGTN